MKIQDLVDSLGLVVFTGQSLLENEVTGGYTSDLLSDVMGFAKEGNVWITLQTHKNVIGVASLKDLSAILLIKGFEPDADALALAEKEDIPILGTKMGAFEISAKIYNLINN